MIHLGLRSSPDLDTGLYTLAGLANAATGWGLAGDSTRCLGARWAVRRTVMPLAAATRVKAGPYLLSLSRMRYRGRWSKGVASRSCWATQASVGWRVTPTWTMRREPSAMTKKANNGRKHRSVTGRKSHAQLSGAWLRRKVAHVCPRGRGARWPRR